MKGFLVAAPQSGSGKTTVTLGLLRALRDRGAALAPAKAGPDYIDPAFHTVASGKTCVNLDPWAMRPELVRILAERHSAGGKLLAVEGMMGLFDGAADGKGSAADLAAMLGLPVLLVVDCARMSQSIAALAKGFNDYRRDVILAGLVLNRVGSARHEAMLRNALEPAGVDVLGAIRTDPALELRSRHLGLVQAEEHSDLERFVTDAAFAVASGLDLDAIASLSTFREGGDVMAAVSRVPPLGQRIAVAHDAAFAFSYHHVLDGWRRRGAEISFFSPLADETPGKDADAVYLPGGYPELHAGRIAAASAFLEAVRGKAKNGVPVYGECGGYMVLGEGLVDEEGKRHEMAGLLPVVTSYAKRKRHLGYRRLTALAGSPWTMPLTAHEFHYSTHVVEGEGEKLFRVTDALGKRHDDAGLRRGSVSGSYMHVIDRAD
ncbi:cobyrinate a,c-diamide synthase [Oricola cellulosilytica]|uniref:Hydrogenobyrinate a,c-diamide synthase n=1 Tax=Oricola cellulosilytica TaxID=1429082 RepID=A0A4V2MNX5_9HYPH|nr:cobyrinate a,c-diamide synthase [Oricola cellulosilytica]TCD15007.1 cobyrinate a,c-diamide synthase [Oricola cellulosilytica]